MTTTNERQDAELDDHLHRLERLEQVFPTPDTAQGGAQRARIHVPTPDSLLTIGARGGGTSEGRAEGPGGVAVYTVENLGAEVHGDTIFDTDGDTILHAGEQVAIVSEGDAAISSNAHIRVGSVEDIEITAGAAGFTDPAFTVRPSVDVPSPPVVDTASPRADVEGTQQIYGAMWKLLDSVSAVRTWQGFLSQTDHVQTAALHRGAATGLSLARGLQTLWEAGRDALIAAGIGFDNPSSGPGSGAKLKVHAAGGIGVTSPSKITVFSSDAVSVSAPASLSLNGGWKASLKSLGNAKVYGVASTTIESGGVVGVKGKVVTGKGDFIEVQGKQLASLTSEGNVLIQAKSEAVLNGDKVVLAGNETHVAASGTLRVDSHEARVEVHGRDRIDLRTEGRVDVQATDGVVLTQEGAEVRLASGEVELRSSQMRARLGSSSFEVGALRVQRNEVRIRGRRVSIG